MKEKCTTSQLYYASGSAKLCRESGGVGIPAKLNARSGRKPNGIPG
jgi:hypothetical protein